MLSRIIGKSVKPAQMRAFSSTAYENIIVTQKEENICLIQLNRPKALNALCDALFKELAQAVKEADADPKTRCIVLTGSEKAFAAGADIKEMKDKNYPDTFVTNMLGWWN
jgi:enoyl-CoA hydratase/carnithine racemase